MSETEEPPAKVLKIDNFDQELSIPDIEPIGNGSTIPDGLGDAASIVDGERPEDEDADVTGETCDNDLTDAEDKELSTDSTDPAQGVDKTEHYIKDATVDTTDDQGDDQDLDKTDQELDKTDLQDVENLDQSEEVDQDGDKLGQDGDKIGQGLVTDQEASEGQEEWLSEGILTDDDANASANHSEDDKPLYKIDQLDSKTVEQNIEETLNHLDGSMMQEGNEKTMDRKTDKNQDIKQENLAVKEEADDGNDTDDLLRMLGEGDSQKSKKKLTKTVKDLRNAMKNSNGASDDDEFEYEGTSIKKLKVTKNAVTKKTAPRAVPEDLHDGDDDDTDQSSDEALETIKKSFNVKKTNIVTKKLPPRQSQELVVVKKATTNRQPALNVGTRRDIVSEKSSEKKTNPPVKPTSRSILKTSTPAKMVASKPNPDKARIEFKPSNTPTPFRATGQMLKTIEIKREDDEFLEENYVMNDASGIESDIEDDRKVHQRIMQPERMDEEVPSDGDSEDEYGSLYDELPSSESDDMDDWFHIDIRAERASDYIPLLGSQAKDLLIEEKKRTSLRVANLRQSLSALTESGKKQAEELRKATMALAELDDLLKAS